MDAMQSYFDYRVMTLCGFPTITLEGTVADWENIQHRVECLREFGLDWWIDCLADTMNRIVASAKGNIDVSFWNSLYNNGGGSGVEYITGWINTLFPYLNNGKRNYAMNWAKNSRHGPSSKDFPIGLSSVPFVWQYYAKEFNMRFVGGLIGVSQAEDWSVQPEAGWAVKEE